MRIMMSQTKDQAILSLAIKEACKVAGEKGSFVGRTAIQKIIYYLKVMGVPVRYNFDLYHYGPFCSEILDDVEMLMADDIIVDTSTIKNKYSNYAPGCNMEKFLRDFNEIEKYKREVSSIANVLVPLKPEQMELLATLDFIFRSLKATNQKGPFKEHVIDKFMEVKKDKFDRESVEEYFDIMVRGGLIEG